MPVVSLKHVREHDRLDILMNVEHEKSHFLKGYRDRVATTKFRALGRIYTIVEMSEDYDGIRDDIKFRYENFAKDGATFEVILTDLSRETTPPSPPTSPAGDVLDLTDAIARSAAAHKAYIRSLSGPRKGTPPPPPPPPPNTPEKKKSK